MILVSCCNEDGAIFGIDENTFEVRKLVDQEARGLAVDNGYVFAANKRGLNLYQPTPSGEWQALITHNSDENWHGVAIRDAVLYSCVSRQNTIMLFDKLLKRIDPIKYDLPAGYPNDICFFQGDLYYCLPQKGAIMRWPHQEPIMRGLEMPHSLAITFDYIYTCNSANGLVIRFNRCLESCHYAEGKFEIMLQVPEYTRGLHVDDNYLWMGLSRHRRTDKSQFRCGVIRKNLTSGFEDYIPLPANEVYDIAKM